MASRIPYNFENFRNVPVQYIPDNILSDLIKQDKRISKMKQVKPVFDAMRLNPQLDKAEQKLSEVNAQSPQADAIRANLEAIKAVAQALNLDIEVSS